MATHIAIEISRVLDYDRFPGWVECVLIDAQGHRHLFVEKIPVVTSEDIDPQSVYPRQGVIACEIEARWDEQDGRSLVRACTVRPWGVESTEGMDTFVVLASQILDK